MERPNVIALEGPVYKCKKCQTHLAVPGDIICKMAQSPRIIEGVPETPKMVYDFRRLYNIFLGPCKINPSVVIAIFCVGCSTSIGHYNRAMFDDGQQYTYWVPRKNLHGPEGSDDEV